jgi:predicted ATPase
METEYKKIKDKVKKDRINRDYLKTKYKDLVNRKGSLESTLSDSEAARKIIHIVSKRTLQNLEYRLSNIGTLALKSIDKNFPELVAKIEIRRNQTEIDFFFKEFGVLQKPLDSSGYGAINIACYGLKISFWTLDKNRHIMILDEPFKDLSPDLQQKASDMVKMIIDKFELQHIIVSHAVDLNYSADRTFEVTKVGKKSVVNVY